MAPEEYQRRRNEIIAGLDGVECIADDVLVYGCGDAYDEDEAVKDHDVSMKALPLRVRQENSVFNKDN